MNTFIITWLLIGVVYYFSFMKMLHDDDSVTMELFNNNKILYIVVFALFLLCGGIMFGYDIWNETKKYIRKCWK